MCKIDLDWDIEMGVEWELDKNFQESRFSTR